ncbi:type I-F CRISPR-associated protein Csy2 [Dokdonella ginsengisoli]|uniref:Type I-F CRISPR-associated protein Csy2 n=1 Tax=Dokdonella ginsengisoli TaxID=363846 RepID=A0ABV9QQD9_9GAMM
MNACPTFSHLLVLPHLRIQNANAISSPLTHGFPSMTAFLGLMWALQRKAHASGLDIHLRAVGVVCHGHQEQASRGGFVSAFHLTRNPVGKDGGSAAIVEEGRIHLELSLLLAADSPRWNLEPEALDGDLAALAEHLAGMRIAGGSVLPPAQPWRHRYKPWAIDLTGAAQDRSALFRKARMRLLPGFALVSRDDRLEQRLQQLQKAAPDATRLDAWLSLSRVNWHWSAEEDDGKGRWRNDRTGQGWIVPIPVGYGALGELHPAGSVANARDATTPFRFVESLYSVGEWISPHRVTAAEQLLWYADTRSETGLYRCSNDHARSIDDELDFIPEFDLT